MKKLLILLTLSVSIVSCGKSGNNVNGGSYSYSNPYVTDGTQSQYLNDLSSKINNNSFGGGHVSGAIGGQSFSGTWNEAVNRFPNGRFNYVSTGSYGNGASSNCSTKWKIFTYCTYSSSGSSYGNAAITRQAYVNQTNYETKRQELMNIVNQATAVQTDGTVYYIQSNSGILYAIDTRYPIIANPSGIQSGYQVEYLYNFSL